MTYLIPRVLSFNAYKTGAAEDNTHERTICCLATGAPHPKYVRKPPGELCPARRPEALVDAPNLRQTSANLLGSVSHEHIKTMLGDGTYAKS